jgi:ankyrin repeat protein
VKLLIANDVDLSRTCLDGWTALHKAALWGHNDLVKILLDAKLDLNKKDSKENTPLQLAVEMRHFYIVNIICRFDYKIDNILCLVVLPPRTSVFGLTPGWFLMCILALLLLHR